MNRPFSAPLRPGLVGTILALCAATMLATTQTIGPNDNWGLDRIDQWTGTDGYYHYGTTGAGINIYIVDSGVLTSLSEFAGRINYVGDFYQSTDFLNPNTTFRPGEDCAPGNGHGTHNASIAAGTTYGVAKQATIWVLRAANCSTGNGDTSAIDRAIQWLNVNAIAFSVVNVSYRPTVNCDSSTPTLPVNEHIVQSIANKHLTYTISAGGCTFRSWSDAVYDKALVAAATTQSDGVFQPANPVPILYAPGASITASSIQPPNYYWTDSGDSYAAPHAAGVAARYLQRHPNALPATVRAKLINLATPEFKTNLLKPLLYSNVPSFNAGNDYDGDGMTDVAVYRPSDSSWHAAYSGVNFESGFDVIWGNASDVVLTGGDYDGDGRADLALYKWSTHTWYALYSRNNFGAGLAVVWGADNDILLPGGDYDGDGKSDPAFYRPSNHTWNVACSNNNYASCLAMQWGINDDIPLPVGDYDGDGKTDLTVYRLSDHKWYIAYSSTNYGTGVAIAWGTQGDVLMPGGDYDGDGKSDVCVYRPSNNRWYVLYSSTNFTSGPPSTVWGTVGDVPLPGTDFDGDGKADFAVYRPSNNFWYAATGFSRQYGTTGDVPLIPVGSVVSR